MVLGECASGWTREKCEDVRFALKFCDCSVELSCCYAFVGGKVPKTEEREGETYRYNQRCDEIPPAIAAAARSQLPYMRGKHEEQQAE